MAPSLHSILAVIVVAAGVSASPTNEEMSSNQYPYLASLEYKGKPHCAATIIKPQYVITDNYCARNIIPADLRVKAGLLQNGGKGPVQEKEVIDMVVYQSVYFAVLKLDSPFDFNENVKQIIVPQSIEDVGKSATLVGFEIQDDAKTTDFLSETVNVTDCVPGEIRESFICTMAEDGEKFMIGEFRTILVNHVSDGPEKDLLLGIVLVPGARPRDPLFPETKIVSIKIPNLSKWIDEAIKSLSK